MRPSRIITAAILTTLVAIAGCTAHPTRPAVAPTPVLATPPTSTFSSTPRPTSPAPPAPSPRVTTTPPSPRATTPSLAAQRLLRAWQAQHRAAALQLASGQAVDAVFARPPRSLRNPTLTGCFNRAGGYDCAYSAGLTWLRMRIEGGASAGYRVQRAMFADRISNLVTSTRLLYQAWAADDRWAALAWGSPNAVQTLFGLHRDRYALTGCELGQTSFICHWKARGYGIRMDVAGGASVGYGVETVDRDSVPIL